MKAAPFEYTRAQDLATALEHLAQYGAEAKLIAGGQSLVPMMAMRLVRPTWLVDIYRLAELRQISNTDQAVVIGAAVRQRELQDNAQRLGQLPLVADALPWVGHQQTRNRGTVGGSLVHADPSAELPLTFLTLGGSALVQSRGQAARRIAAVDFFQGAMFTAVADDECLVSTEWPIHNTQRTGTAFEETSIRHGDFAMASACCLLSLNEQGQISDLRLGVGGVDSIPLAFPELARQWLGQTPGSASFKALAHAVSAQLDPHSDVHVQAPFRRHLASVLLERVLNQAAERARAAG